MISAFFPSSPRFQSLLPVAEKQQQVFAFRVVIADEERILAPRVDKALDLLNVVFRPHHSIVQILNAKTNPTDVIGKLCEMK